MHRRTLLLAALLLIVCGVAIRWRLQADSMQLATEQSASVQSAPRKVSQIASFHHANIEDGAGILDPFGPRIGRQIEAMEADLGIDLRILTLNDSDASIEEQADRAFQKLRIGAKASTGGLLIVINPTLKSARIEVGYTLEGALTDLHMGRIARDQLAPYTAAGSAGMAVMDVLHYLRDHVYVAAALGELTLDENLKHTAQYAEYEKFLSGGAGARATLEAVPQDLDLKRVLAGAERARYAPARSVEASVAAFLSATRDFAGDPTLELFTEGSRAMRAYYPLARFEELQRYKRIQASMPLIYREDGDYAVATSNKPALGFVPVLLHREQGMWRIDLVETWKNLFFNQDGNYYLRNNNTHYAGLLHDQFGKGGYYDIAPYDTDLMTIEQALKAVDSAYKLAPFYRAEIWLRNTFVFPQAFAEYQAALRALPNDPIVLETYADRMQYLGFPELAVPAYEKVGKGAELKLVQAYWDSNDLAQAKRWTLKALEENRYDWYALRWLRHIAEREKNTGELEKADAALASIAADERDLAQPVALWFDPQNPHLDTRTTLDVGGTKVFDHSEFGVGMINYSGRPVVIDSVQLTSYGTAAASGLGDIKGYWKYPSGGYSLGAKQRAYFSKTWGFVVDTGHEHVRYAFHLCWHGADDAKRQCRTQWVDVAS